MSFSKCLSPLTAILVICLGVAAQAKTSDKPIESVEYYRASQVRHSEQAERVEALFAENRISEREYELLMNNHVIMEKMVNTTVFGLEILKIEAKSRVNLIDGGAVSSSRKMNRRKKAIQDRVMVVQDSFLNEHISLYEAVTGAYQAAALRVPEYAGAFVKGSEQHGVER